MTKAKDPRRQYQGAVSKAKGKFFEDYIDKSFDYYRYKGLAIIEKTPEPMRPSKSLGNGKFIAFFDPAVGAGALLIAFANECRAQGVNYQEHILFVGQDIDYVAAMMCYIQLSLLGCPGYVIVGDTLATPPTEPLTNQNVWYTPLYFSDIWQWRIMFKALGALQRPRVEKPESVKAAPPQAKATEEVQLTLF